MEKTDKKTWWQGSWTIPLSIMLHVLVGGTYLLWSGYTPAPAEPEPETVNVEMVEPPKEEPPKSEEKKAEEPPPPAEEKPQPPPPPPRAQTPLIAVRPDKTQLDERDEPGKQEETGGQEQPKPADEPQPSQPEPKPAEEAQKDVTPPPTPSSNKATAEQGEIPAVEAEAPVDIAAVAVPTPKPDIMKKPVEETKAAQDGEGNPNLKPAKKILASGTRPRPMLRQILGNLPPVERVAQLCMAEVTAQINDQRRGQLPFEGLQPHTGRNFPIAGNVMDAQGAFNVGPQWFPVNYRCEVDIDNYIVTDFRFQIGQKLSADDVKRLKLPDVY